MSPPLQKNYSKNSNSRRYQKFRNLRTHPLTEDHGKNATFSAPSNYSYTQVMQILSNNREHRKVYSAGRRVGTLPRGGGPSPSQP